MVEFKSQKSTIHQPVDQVYNYLSVPANYEILMPSNVRKFKALEEGAELDIQGIGDVHLAFTRKESPNLLELKPQNKVPFDFDLQWDIKEVDANTTEIQAVIHAKLNFMMRMMAEKLLKDFLDVQVHKLTQHLNND
ncbi:MAG: SRPBCC family protein [Bacteroidia bacterium]